MFSQVVGTLLRLTVAHAQHWLPVQGSHAVPVYGFERYADPPPLEVDVLRLLETFARGRVSSGEMWRAMVTPGRMQALEVLADEAAAALDETTRPDTPSDVTDIEFHLPDELWARILYDLALYARDPAASMDAIVAALVPIYFARVASLVIETRDMTTQQAEPLVERQARAFELAKPRFVERWQAGEGIAKRARKRKTSKADAGKSKAARARQQP